MTRLTDRKRKRVGCDAKASDDASSRLSSELSAALSKMASYEYVDAFSMFDRLEKQSRRSGNSLMFDRCCALKAELHVRVGDHARALRCLLRCRFSGTSVRAAARVARSLRAACLDADIAPVVTDLLALCLSSPSSRKGAEDAERRSAPETALLWVEWLCRTGRLCAVRDYIATVRSDLSGAEGPQADRAHRVLRQAGPWTSVIGSIFRDWLVATPTAATLEPRAPATAAPYATFTRPRRCDPEMDGCAHVARGLAKAVRRPLPCERPIVFYTGSMLRSLQEFVLALNDADPCDRECAASRVSVRVAEGPYPSESECAPGILSVVKERTKRSCKRRGGFAALAEGVSPTAELAPAPATVEAAGCPPLSTGYLSLDRAGELPLRPVSAATMEACWRRAVLDRVGRHCEWSLVRLSLVVFDGLLRHHQVFHVHRERLTLHLCFLLYFLLEHLKACVRASCASSSGLFFTSEAVAFSGVLEGSDHTRVRLRSILRRSGVRLLCLVLDASRCPAALLRDVCAPLLIDHPQDFLGYMFNEVGSLLLLECNRGGVGRTSRDVALRARVLYVMARRLVCERLPKKGGAPAGGRGGVALSSLRGISRYMHSLWALSHSRVLSEVSRNMHLKLSLRHRDRPFNFHSSLTCGSFDLGVACVERRHLSLLRTLQSYQPKD